MRLLETGLHIGAVLWYNALARMVPPPIGSLFEKGLLA
jgi:hypothetical protein